MGRELQKHKNRSSISKVRRKPKSKKRVLNNSIIAANWDKNQTLAQNYKRLGLTAKINKNTGGVERKVSDVQREAEEDDDEEGRKEDGLRITGEGRKTQIDVHEARIERDPDTGAILRVLDQGGGSERRANPLADPLAALDSDSEPEIFDQHGNAPPAAASTHRNTTDVVRQLEDEASRPAPKYKRKMPEGERQFVEELVSKYGDDIGKMARDHKVNYMQRSEGDLRRRIKRWRESGGSASV